MLGFPQLADASPYQAAELAQGAEFATEATDIYAAGVALIELFTGESAAKWQDESGVVSCPPLNFDDPYLTQAETNDLREILNVMVESNDRKRMQTATEAREFLADLIRDYSVRETAGEKRETASPPPVPAKPASAAPKPPFGSLYQAGDRLEDRYRIERVLGQGATANVYLAYDEVAEENYVLKQLREPLEAGSLAFNEFKTLTKLRHRGVMEVIDVFASDKPFQLKLEYIEGYSLDYLDSER